MSQQERIDAINSKIVGNNRKIRNMLAKDASSATANDIRVLKTAWVGGEKIIGAGPLEGSFVTFDGTTGGTTGTECAYLSYSEANGVAQFTTTRTVLHL